MAFRQFIREFQFLAQRFPLHATEYYAYNSVESLKLMTIIFGKMGQKWKKAKTRFFFYYLRYRYSDQISIYIICNRKTSSFDYESR